MKPKDSSLAQSLVHVLQDDRASRALIDTAIDYFVDQPVENWLDLEVFFECVQSVYQPKVAEQLMTRSIASVLERTPELVVETGQSFQTWLTPELDAELRSLLARAQLLSPDRVDRFIHHPITHHVIQSFVEETLHRFIQRVKPSAESGSLLGSASRGALSWASKASRGALGGLSDQLQQHLGSLTSEFVSASMSVLLDQLGQIISSQEVSQRFNQVTLALYDELRNQTPSDYIRLFEVYRPESEKASLEWSGILAEWFSHLLELPELADFVGRAHQELITSLSHRTLREVIGDDESLESVKETARDLISPQLSAFASSEMFKKWCNTYLD